jgi:hypothetical protein
MNDMTFGMFLFLMAALGFGFAILAGIVELVVGHGEKERGNREVISHR